MPILHVIQLYQLHRDGQDCYTVIAFFEVALKRIVSYNLTKLIIVFINNSNASNCSPLLSFSRETLLTNHQIFYQWALSFTPCMFGRAGGIFGLIRVTAIFRTHAFTFLKSKYATHSFTRTLTQICLKMKPH